jgi:hypothetical protein
MENLHYLHHQGLLWGLTVVVLQLLNVLWLMRIELHNCLREINFGFCFKTYSHQLDLRDDLLTVLLPPQDAHLRMQIESRYFLEQTDHNDDRPLIL